MKLSRPAFAFPAILLLLAQAHAVEPEKAAARLKALVEAHGASFAWNSVGGNGDTVSIEGATVTPPGESRAIHLGTIEMAGVEETDGGALAAERLTASGYSHKRGGVLVETSGLEIGGLVLPDAQGAVATPASLRFKTMHIDSVRASRREREIFSATGLVCEMEYPPAGDGPIEVDVTAERFRAEAGRNPVVDDIADIMGIRAYTGRLSARGAWSPARGDVALESAELLLDGSGKLTLSFAGSGYTRELVLSGQSMNLDFGGGDLQSVVTQGMAILGAVSQVTFDGASLRFEPAPGVRPDPQKARAARDRIARDLAPFGKRFAEPSLAEIDEYIADPRSLEVRAAPAEPVGMATVMLGLMAAPKGLPQQLGLSIKANE